MTDLNSVRAAIRAGDKAKARQLLKPILKDTPTADAWTLAAMAVDDDQQAITCLKRALALDEWHTAANRMLSQLQQVDTSRIQKTEQPNIQPLQDDLAESQRKIRNRFILVMGFVALVMLIVIVLSLIGFMPTS
ncbi:MAG: hypothetical protein D6711_00665 [Chloroflexi bacterium]|nr:MAG: hypothetical protein D6711_00665 [Chloroflexota bacterium]